MNFEKQLTEDLHRYLIAEGKVDAKLPECPDLEDLWRPVAKAYLPDGVRAFSGYPLTSLGWIMFVGTSHHSGIKTGKNTLPKTERHSTTACASPKVLMRSTIMLWKTSLAFQKRNARP